MTLPDGTQVIHRPLFFGADPADRLAGSRSHYDGPLFSGQDVGIF